MRVVPIAVPAVDDFAEMHRTLQTYAAARVPAPDEALLLHLTTAPYTAQLSLYLLNQADQLRGELLQSAVGQGHTAPGWAELALAPYHAELARLDAPEAGPQRAPAPVA